MLSLQDVSQVMKPFCSSDNDYGISWQDLVLAAGNLNLAVSVDAGYEKIVF